MHITTLFWVGTEDVELIIVKCVYVGSVKDVCDRTSHDELCCKYWKAINVLGKMCNEWVKSVFFLPSLLVHASIGFSSFSKCELRQWLCIINTLYGHV